MLALHYESVKDSKARNQNGDSAAGFALPEHKKARSC